MEIRALAQELETYWRELRMTEAETKALEWLQAEGAESCGLHHCKPVSFGVAVLVWIALVIGAVIFYGFFIRPLLCAGGLL